jgi:hypothetical protein
VSGGGCVEGSYKRTAEAALTISSAPRTSVATSAPVGGAAHAPARPLRAVPHHLRSGLDGVARHLATLAQAKAPPKPLPPPAQGK